jgi:DNA-binding CsgD family transcriptional regulator
VSGGKLPAAPSERERGTANTANTANIAVAEYPPVRENRSPLSEAELRVAQLAALGHTNRQISARLFITVSTVEQHLTSTYRKLGISGRRALSRALKLPSGVTPASRPSTLSPRPQRQTPRLA